MHELCVFLGRAELERAHHGREAAVGEGVEDEGDCGWREWLVEYQERKLGGLRFEDLRGIGEEGERVGRIFDGWVGRRWGLESVLEAVEEGLEV